MLIDSSGKKVGLLSITDALKSAKDANLDLVQVSPSNAQPIVCKLLDYGKHLFDKKKSISSSKVKLKRKSKQKCRPSQILVTIILN